MSLVILVLIIILVYLTLAKYSSPVTVAGAIFLIFSMTTFFLIYSLGQLDGGRGFVFLGTIINLKVLIHITIAWYVVDVISAFLIFKNYRHYLNVNSNLKR